MLAERCASVRALSGMIGGPSGPVCGFSCFDRQTARQTREAVPLDRYIWHK
jgi:hypothetical protein